MNSLVIVGLVLFAVVVLVLLLSMKDAFVLTSNKIKNPLFEINNEDILTISKLQNEGSLADAVSCAKELAKKEPNNLYNRYILGMAFLKNGQTREAVFQLETVIKHQPDHLDTREKLADCYIDLKFYQRAILEYDYILRHNTDDINVLRKAAFAYAKTKKNKEAIDIYQKITMMDPEDTDSLSKLYELYIEQGEYAKAIETLNYALNQSPSNKEFLLALGDLYQKTNNNDKAIQINLQLAELLNPDNDEDSYMMQNINIKLADLYTQKECYDEALDYYNQVIAFNPKEEETFGCRIAYIHFKQNRDSESIWILDNMIEDNPDSQDAVALLAQIYMQKGDYELAAKMAKRAIERAKNNKIIHFYNNLISNIYCEWGTGLLNTASDQALSKFAEALKYDSHNHEVYYKIANISHKNKEYSSAISYLKKASELCPTNAEYKTSLAFVFDDIGHFEEAAVAFDEALKIEPLNVDTWVSKGVLLAKHRRYSEAIELFSQVLSIKESADVYYNLALAYEYAGNIKLAYNNYKKAIELAPDHIEAKNNFNILKKHMS